MNGASALPAVSEIATPSTSNRMITGISQNFFRIFRKPHVSLRIDRYRIRPSPLLEHLAVALEGAFTLGFVHPVTRLAVLELQIQWPPSEEPQHQSNRGKHQIEEYRKNDSGHHPRQHLGELHPEPKELPPKTAQQQREHQRKAPGRPGD